MRKKMGERGGTSVPRIEKLVSKDLFKLWNYFILDTFCKLLGLQ